MIAKAITHTTIAALSPCFESRIRSTIACKAPSPSSLAPIVSETCAIRSRHPASTTFISLIALKSPSQGERANSPFASKNTPDGVVSSLAERRRVHVEGSGSSSGAAKQIAPLGGSSWERT